MIIPGQFGFNCPSGFREEAFWNIFPTIKWEQYPAFIDTGHYIYNKIGSVHNLYRYETLYLQGKIFDPVTLKINRVSHSLKD